MGSVPGGGNAIKQREAGIGCFLLEKLSIVRQPQLAKCYTIMI